MKIFCIGRNYKKHAAELNNVVPKSPLIFIKPSTAIVPGNEYEIPPFCENLHYECEWVLRFSKSLKNASHSEALDAIDAMTLGIDFTERNLQDKLKQKSHPWERAKGFDGSAYIGKWLPFREGPQHFSLNKNGAQAQIGNTEDMIFSLQDLIKEISQFFTIESGDLLFTGTPEGVGPVKSGDKLQASLNEQAVFSLNIL